MNNTGADTTRISDAEQTVSEKIAEEGAAAAGWAQSFAAQLSDKLKETGAKLQQVSLPAAASSRKAASAAEAERPAAERAEEFLDRAGEQIGLFAAAFSHQVRKSVALTREEAEDILAEAQSLQHKAR